MQDRSSAHAIYHDSHRLDVVFQAVEDGITVQEPGGRIVYANVTAAHLLGFETPEALMSAPVEQVLQRFEIFDEHFTPVALSEFPGRRALLGEQPAEAILGFRVRETGEERWAVVKSRPIFDDGGSVALAVNVFSDITDRKRAADEREELLVAERAAREEAEALQRFFSFLAEAGQVLASSLDYETTLSSVASLAVPHIADWCAIHVVEEDGTVQQLAVAHVDPSKVELVRELERKYPFNPGAPSGAAYVMRSGEAELIPEIPDELLVASAPDEELLSIARDLGLRSSMVVPLVARGAVLGAITMLSAESERRFSPADLALARELASRAALAVDNARLYRRSARTAAEQAAILHHMADGVVMFDAAGTIRFVNTVGRDLTGMGDSIGTLGDLLANTGTEGDPDRPLPAERSAIHRALHGETVLNAERRLRRPDGSQAIVRVSATPIMDEEGALLGVVAVFNDITDERRLEEEKDAFLAAAAHDLKTPLATIKGLAQVVQRRLVRLDTPDAARLARSLSQIDDAVMRMAHLVNDLLDVSRIQMGRPLELNPSPVDLVSLVRRVVDDTQHTTDRHRIRFTTRVDELWGSWDIDRLARVFSNLLANAVKYSPDGGNIDVELKTENGASPHAVVQVRDHGVGIPAGEQDRIFERFYRARNVQTRIGGTGVGLASARQVIDQHGGTIEVESEEGKGATFAVRLPIA